MRFLINKTPFYSNFTNYALQPKVIVALIIYTITWSTAEQFDIQHTKQYTINTTCPYLEPTTLKLKTETHQSHLIKMSNGADDKTSSYSFYTTVDVGTLFLCSNIYIYTSSRLQFFSLKSHIRFYIKLTWVPPLVFTKLHSNTNGRARDNYWSKLMGCFASSTR